MNSPKIPPELAQMLTEFPGRISTVKSKHPISMEAQMSYMQFHEKVDTEDVKEDEVLKASKKLFQKRTSPEDKKVILFKLAHLGTLASYQTLSKYLDYAGKQEEALITWTVLCSEECRMTLESELLEEDTAMIMSPAGGDGVNMRYYFIISSEQGKHFTSDQKKMIREHFRRVAKEIKCKIENIEFGENYTLFTALHPWEVAPAELIERGIEACNKSTNFLRFHYYCGNMEKPDEKTIGEYLDELQQCKDLPMNFTRLTPLEEEEVVAALEKGDKIEAIRLVQRFTRAGLKASKEYVDELQGDIS